MYKKELTYLENRYKSMPTVSLFEEKTRLKYCVELQKYHEIEEDPPFTLNVLNLINLELQNRRKKPYV